MSTLEITALFQDGKSRVYRLPAGSKVSDLTKQIDVDPEITIPPDRELRILYLGHFLDADSVLSAPDGCSQFSVNCFLRLAKSATFVDDDHTIHPIAPTFENEAGDVGVQRSDNVARGFDRLLSLNVSQSELNEMRDAFHRAYHTPSLQVQDRIAVEEDFMSVNQLDLEGVLMALRLLQFFNQPLAAIQQSAEPAPHNNNFDTESETPLLSNRVNEPQANGSWKPFLAGIFFGFLFQFSWCTLIAVLHPNKSVLVGYLFGCGLFYMFQILMKE